MVAEHHTEQAPAQDRSTIKGRKRRKVRVREGEGRRETGEGGEGRGREGERGRGREKGGGRKAFCSRSRPVRGMSAGVCWQQRRDVASVHRSIAPPEGREGWEVMRKNSGSCDHHVISVTMVSRLSVAMLESTVISNWFSYSRDQFTFCGPNISRSNLSSLCECECVRGCGGGVRV